ncbi:MAG: PEP-CTERM sorting domain-containing protein, partial [Burkholderiaceae bacterium]
MNILKLSRNVALTLGVVFGAISSAQAVPCSTITNIGLWEAAGSCDQGDKVWTIGANTLDDNVQVLFSSPIESIHVMQLVGFDNSNLAGAWSIDYSISVTDPNFFISAMFAGADSPGGSSLLTKDVTGDEVFSLSVVNGVENAGSQRLGLSATTLNISEDFSVNAGANLLSVSNTYEQTERLVPEPSSLALIGLGLLA